MLNEVQTKNCFGADLLSRMVFFFLPECNARIPCKLKCLKVSHRRKMKEKKITSKVGQRQIRHRIGFLKLFFSMPRPRRDGSTLTYFWLKCFITMALQFKEWNFLKYLKLWLTKNTVLMTFTYIADIEQHFDKNEKIR